MSEQARTRRFREVVMPHLDAAYNLARWLMNNQADAEDMVQEACLRAFRYLDGLAGDNARPWLLSIVRHACYDALRRRDPRVVGLSAEVLDDATETMMEEATTTLGPEATLIQQRDREQLDRLIASLPAPYREVLILRELEELPYRDIADIVGVPPGTVMSRLARARALLRAAWNRTQAGEARRGL